MGKSSLLMRTVKAGLDAGKKIALLDFQLLDDKTKAEETCSFADSSHRSPSNLNCRTASTRTGIRGSRIRRTARDTSSAVSCSRSAAPVRWPSTRPTRFSRHGLGRLLRDAAKLAGLRAHPTRRSWKNFDIVLSTSTEPQFFIDRPHESPFNVGVVLPLEDFLPDQVARLNALHPGRFATPTSSGCWR